MPTMIRALSATAACAVALVSASCCCTGESKPPRLRPMPKFQEIQPATTPAEAPVVRHEK